MRRVRLSESLLQGMKSHARESYPDECCGFLIGTAGESLRELDRTIVESRRAQNDHPGEKRRRFLISPEELRDLERSIEGTSRAVVGFYHSHPDHPARPSQFDQDHAWPWYSYLILATTSDDVPAIGAFELDPESSVFHEVPLVSADAPAPSPAMGRR